MINIHLEALQELIDKYKESLSNAKDLYDYQKNIASQTKNITNLQKQLSAYEGDTSEEARATIQKLRKQLEDAETQLKETEWDKYISETEKFLDDMYEDYEELLNEYLEDIDKLMNDMITDTNKNAGDIKTAIENVSGAVGYELTKEMQKIISGKNIATDYGDNGFDNTKTYKAITGIKTEVKAIKDQMVKEAADAKKKANTNVKGATSYNGVDYSSVFDLDYYMEHNADLKKKFGTDYNKYIEHFVNHGMKEGRQGSSTFNVQTYKKNYKDLQKVYGNDLVKYYEHYIKYGKKEGRKAYAKGSKYIPYDQLAWTQEEGQELIFRKSDGAMLTPLGAGDKVFTAQMTDNLYDLAKASVNVKPFVPESTFTGGNDVDISIAVDKVVADNPEQFARQLIQTLKNNSKAESIIQEMTLGQAMGNGKLNKRKY